MRVVGTIEDARTALIAGEEHLASPYAAACHAGVNYYLAMVKELRIEFPDQPFTFTLCCGEDPAIAHDALRLGFRDVRLAVGDILFAEMKAIAEPIGATIHRS
jgi:hypothetical protein